MKDNHRKMNLMCAYSLAERKSVMVMDPKLKKEGNRHVLVGKSAKGDKLRKYVSADDAKRIKDKLSRK